MTPNYDTWQEAMGRAERAEALLEAECHLNEQLLKGAEEADARWQKAEARAQEAESARQRAEEQNKRTYCAYCGAEFLVDGDAAKVTEHIYTCAKHPMRDVEKRAEKAEAALITAYNHTELGKQVAEQAATIARLRSILPRVVEKANARIKALNNSRAHYMNRMRPDKSIVEWHHKTAEEWHAIRDEVAAALTLPAAPEGDGA